MINDRLSRIEFAENNEPRCPVVLLLDTSRSMEGAPIEQLNAGLAAFKTDVMNDSLAALRVDIAIITFGGSVQAINVRAGESVVVPFDADQAFVTADSFHPPSLQVHGSTPMGQATRQALTLLRDRKDLYNRHAISYYRPWLFLITDGEPTDVWEPAADQLRQEVQRKGLTAFAIGVEEANMQTLSRFSTMQPRKLRGLEFTKFFTWLSGSLSAVSRSQPGDQVPLPSPDGWSYVSA